MQLACISSDAAAEGDAQLGGGDVGDQDTNGHHAPTDDEEVSSDEESCVRSSAGSVAQLGGLCSHWWGDALPESDGGDTFWSLSTLIPGISEEYGDLPSFVIELAEWRALTMRDDVRILPTM